jgi:integrase
MLNTELGEEQSFAALAETVKAKAKKPGARGRDGVYMRGRKYWISYTDAQGRRRLESTEAPTLQQARMIREREVMKAEQQRRFGIVEWTERTFTDFAKEYLEYQRGRLTPKGYGRTEGIVEKQLKSVFGKMQLPRIRRADIVRFVADRLKDRPGSVNRELNVLKHMLNHADELGLIPFNPAAKVKGRKDPPGRLRYLQPTELYVVVQACPSWLQPIVLLLALTGMRRGEVLGLRWLDVDLKGGRILLPQTKNGDGRVVHLNDSAVRVLGLLGRANDAKSTDLVFPPSEHLTPENVSLCFLRTCRKVKIADFRLHDLRHTCASWLAMSGASLATVADQLGHKDLRMTKRYTHLNSAYLKSAMSGLDAAFAPELGKLPMLQAPAQD